MIEIQYIIGFAMAAVNIFKSSISPRWSSTVPFIAILLCVVCNILNAVLFSGDVLVAGKDAFIAGGIVIGLFAGGDAVGKSISSE